MLFFNNRWIYKSHSTLWAKICIVIALKYVHAILPSKICHNLNKKCIIMECGSNSVYRDWAGLKINGGLYIRYRSVCVNCEARSRQNNFDNCKSASLVLWSYPQSSPNLLCSREIPPQKSPFCCSFFLFVSHNSLMKACKNTEKSPQFSALHEDVPFDT